MVQFRLQRMGVDGSIFMGIDGDALTEGVEVKLFLDAVDVTLKSQENEQTPPPETEKP